MKHTFACRVCTILLALFVLCGAIPLVLPAMATAPSYVAEAIYPAPQAHASICGADEGATEIRPHDVVAMQIVLTADALSVAVSVPSYSNNSGSATMALFHFDTDYDTTLLGSPVAEHTFADFPDSASLTFRFSTDKPLPAGEYILLLYDMHDDTPGEHNGTGIGMWQKGAHEGQRAYVNGSYVSGRSFPVAVNYVLAPATLYGIPTAPAVGEIDLAPHMGAVLDFRREETLSAFGGSNATTTAYKTENGESFTRLQAADNAGDPYIGIHLPDTVIKCSEYKYLLVKLRRSEGSELASQMFFTTDTVSISEAASVRKSYADTTDWQYVIYNLSASTAYAGLLQSLRFDYYTSCKDRGRQYVDVQYMALFTDEEAAKAFHDNFADFAAPTPPDTGEETAPDYSTYIGTDAPGEAMPGKLAENGMLGYLYQDIPYSMDFEKSPEAYMEEGGFAFSGIENALVKDGALFCKAFAAYELYTRRPLGDRYGLRGGTLSMDLLLEAGEATFILRQILPHDEPTKSGIVFTLTPDGHLTVSERDGLNDSAKLEIDLSNTHRVGVEDKGDALSLVIDGRAVYTLTWDSVTRTLTTPGGKTFSAIHVPNAGYAAYHAVRTRGTVDNVTYTYTDIVPKSPDSATRPTDYSTWVATDDLGRTTPTSATLGERTDKEVGIFYFLIHSDDMGGRYVNDVTRFYLEGGTALVAQKLSSFAGRNGAYWAEPYFGYYSSHDEWVYRKHAYMLAAAGVDFIFLDVSNNRFYVEQATILFDTWKAIRDEGGDTPQIAFMYGDMPFTLLNGLYTLLDPFYNNPAYTDLLYKRDGKPLLLGNNDTLESRRWTCSDTTPQSREDYKNRLEADPAIKAFYDEQYLPLLEKFTVRKCWAWQAKRYRGYWDWLQESPQALGTNPDGKAEQISVSMGVHAHTSRGRSYTDGNATYNPNGNFGFTLGTAKYGYFFAEQFEYALTQDVDVIMITGWNEWYAGVHTAPSADQTCGQTPTPNYYMVDQMSPEYSRDGEPMRLRDGEGFGDNYYYQMVSYIRRFKGMDQAPATVNGGTLPSADADWSAVAPAFTDMRGDANLRHAASFSSEFLYVNGTARNDLDIARVSQDESRLYFSITTTLPLITVDDSAWMNLYIDADGDPATGWEGFDYLLNRSRTDKTVSVEHFTDGEWTFETVGEADYSIGASSLVIAVDKATLGLPVGKAVSLNFKWADNARVEGDVMRFMELGDTAPNDRFVFAYTASTVEDERRTDSETTDTVTPDTATPETPVTEAPTQPATPPEKPRRGCASALSAALILPLLATLPFLCKQRRKDSLQS